MTDAQRRRVRAIKRRKETIALDYQEVNVPTWGNPDLAMQGDVIVACHTYQWATHDAPREGSVIIDCEGNCHTGWQLSGVAA